MNKINKITLASLLTALASALSVLERAIPLSLFIPLPGIRLGLANIVTLYTIYALPSGLSLATVLCRCFIVFMLSGSTVGLAMSLFGSLLALLTMQLAKRLRSLSIYGISVLGAAAHGTGQILCACIFTKSLAALFYLPVLLLCGIACGLLTASATHGVLKQNRLV